MRGIEWLFSRPESPDIPHDELSFLSAFPKHTVRGSMSECSWEEPNSSINWLMRSTCRQNPMSPNPCRSSGLARECGIKSSLVGLGAGFLYHTLSGILQNPFRHRLCSLSSSSQNSNRTATCLSGPLLEFAVNEFLSQLHPTQSAPTTPLCGAYLSKQRRNMGMASRQQLKPAYKIAWV